MSPQPRFSPLFRRLLWGVRETKNPTPRNKRYYSLLAKEVCGNFVELRKAEVRRKRHLQEGGRRCASPEGSVILVPQYAPAQATMRRRAVTYLRCTIGRWTIDLESEEGKEAFFA